MEYYFMKNIAPKINEVVKKKVEENQVKKEEKRVKRNRGIMIMFDFMKQKYKQMIKEAGFEDIIEFNDLHSDGKFVGNKLRCSDKEMINQKLINKQESPMVLAQKIEKLEKLEKLEKDLKEEAFSKKKIY